MSWYCSCYHSCGIMAVQLFISVDKNKIFHPRNTLSLQPFTLPHCFKLFSSLDSSHKEIQKLPLLMIQISNYNQAIMMTVIRALGLLKLFYFCQWISVWIPPQTMQTRALFVNWVSCPYLIVWVFLLHNMITSTSVPWVTMQGTLEGSLVPFLTKME